MAHPPATRPQMLTANDLKQGDVLYWKAGGWVKAFGEGDVFTDVVGARLAGLRVILTRPIEPHDWAGTRILRFFERLVLGSR